MVSRKSIAIQLDLPAFPRIGICPIRQSRVASSGSSGEQINEIEWSEVTTLSMSVADEDSGYWKLDVYR